MPNAARISDKVLHDAPHCHAPIHPPGPTPTPLPHPPRPFTLVSAGVPTVLINGLQAAVVSTMGEPCVLPTCAPGAGRAWSRWAPRPCLSADYRPRESATS